MLPKAKKKKQKKSGIKQKRNWGLKLKIKKFGWF